MARGGWEGEGVEERGLGGGLRGCRNGLGAVTAGYTCRWWAVVFGCVVLFCVILCCVG